MSTRAEESERLLLDDPERKIIVFSEWVRMLVLAVRNRVNPARPLRISLRLGLSGPGTSPVR